jgi:acyl carrier protein
MNEDVASKTKHIIRKQLDVDEGRLTPTAAFVEDLGADSLSLVELTLALEEEFDIDITDEEAAGIRTVQDAVRLVERHAKEAEAVRRSPVS